MTIEQYVRRHPLLLRYASQALRWWSPIAAHPLVAVPGYLRLVLDWRRFLDAGGRARLADFYPCLYDRVGETPVDHHYVYQAGWAFKRILAHAPRQHVDIGSDVRFIAMLSQAVPLTFVDIRPPRIELPGLDCKAGTVLALPYPDDHLESVSCLHVIEHIGLGRYGDPLDPKGSAKAAQELARVLAPGGRLYVSAPVGRERVCFNAHRVFRARSLMQLFPALALREFSWVNDAGAVLLDSRPETADAAEYGCGLYVFEKPRISDSGGTH